MSPGMRVAQAIHAALGSGFRGREQPFVIVLEVRDEERLYDLANKINRIEPSLYLWQEPDLDNELTAISFYGSDETKRFTKGLPLASG